MDEPSRSLIPPFVVLEPDESDFLFCESVLEITEDRHDCLSQPLYLGHDVTGRAFRVELAVHERPRLGGFLKEYDEERRIIVEDGPPAPELAARRVRRWLELMSSTWPDLSQRAFVLLPSAPSGADLRDLILAGLAFQDEARRA